MEQLSGKAQYNHKVLMREKRQVYSQKNMWEPDAGVEEF
jgi:hypothetical protein